MTPLATPKPMHGSDVDDGAARAGGKHASGAFLRPIEHGVEIGRQHAPPFFLGQIDGAAGRHHAGIVDQDGHGAEALLGGIERGLHRGAIAHIGLDRDGAAAGFLDPRLHIGEAIGAARHQHDRGAVLGKTFGKAHAKPARRAGDQRDLAVEIEDLCCGHGCRGSPSIRIVTDPLRNGKNCGN